MNRRPKSTVPDHRASSIAAHPLCFLKLNALDEYWSAVPRSDGAGLIIPQKKVAPHSILPFVDTTRHNSTSTAVSRQTLLPATAEIHPLATAQFAWTPVGAVVRLDQRFTHRPRFFARQNDSNDGHRLPRRDRDVGIILPAAFQDRSHPFPFRSEALGT